MPASKYTLLPCCPEPSILLLQPDVEALDNFLLPQPVVVAASYLTEVTLR